jgi:hypothetical protein
MYNGCKKSRSRRGDKGEKLEEFVNDDELTIDHLESARAQIHAQARTILQSVTRLYEHVNDLDPREFYGEEELWRELERLYKLIQRKFRDADRRVA